MDAPYIRKASRMNLQLPPGASDCLKNLLQQRHEDLKSLQTKAAETRKLLYHLESEVQQAEQDIAICSTLTLSAPVRKLPMELLSHTFVIASAGDIYDVMQPEKCRKPICQVLVHVSKYWRDVAFQTKEIWQHQFLIYGAIAKPDHGTPVDLDYGGCARRLLGAVEMYGEHLTHVELCNTQSVVGLQAVHDIILGLKSQLVSLHLVGTPGRAYVPNLNMPQLERLFVHSSPSSRADLPVHFNTPRLKKLFLAVPDSYFNSENLLIPWHQLTHMSIGISYSTSSFQFQRGVTRPSASRIIEVIRKLPNLVHLHLSALRHCSVMTASAHAQVHLPRLKVLEIHDTRFGFAVTPAPHEGDTEDVWNRAFPFNLSAPALETFDLVFSGGENRYRSPHTPQYHQRIRAIGSFLQRAPSLSKVRIVICPTRGDKWFGGLQAEGASIFPSGSCGIIRFAGDGAFFKAICGIIPRKGGPLSKAHRFVRLGTLLRAPTQALVKHEMWMDRWIDRYVEGCEYTPQHPTPPTYNQASINAIEAVFGLLGDHGGIVSGAERRVYLAI